MQSPVSSTESVQDALGIAAIGEGYLLRSDGVAVGLVELTPPDLSLHDADSLALLLDSYEAVLRSSGERMLLSTYAVSPDLRPLLATLAEAQRRAANFTSYTVLNALTDFLTDTLRMLATIPTVRWVLAVPSVAPELPPRGTWGELFPAAVVGHLKHLGGDPVTEVLSRTRRLVGALTALGLEPPPHLLSAAEIRVLLALALDPIRAQSHPPSALDSTLRPLQLATPDHLPGSTAPGSGE